MIESVEPSLVKNVLMSVKPVVRWAANQAGIVVSPSRFPPPYLTTSSPKPMITSEDEHPGDDEAGDERRTGQAGPGGRLVCGGGRARQFGPFFWLQALLHRGGDRPSGCLPGQLERRRGDPQPGDPDRPAAEDI